MRFIAFVLLLLLASALALAEPAAESAGEGGSFKPAPASQKPFALQFDQVHSITYERDGKKTTRYFKLVVGAYKRFRLVEVDGIEGKEIEMPELRKIYPNLIAKDEDDYNLETGSDGSTDTWVLRTTGFFFAQLTAKRDATTRPQLITAANGLSYRYFGTSPFMEKIVSMNGPNGERALEVKVWNKTETGYKVVRTVDCQNPAPAFARKPAASPKKNNSQEP